ncbi:hypothetical protein CSAL01_05646 [Colletotrichum salicis]|uniref:Uncharacterized protein n=1 Tax=Colletotrichum salicis TaxID=1209931 RepID=A0A135TJF4_9PEZI|nr:hypothetical protein CSAL01_05646 [Colletotrichum salicis]
MYGNKKEQADVGESLGLGLAVCEPPSGLARWNGQNDNAEGFLSVPTIIKWCTESREGWSSVVKEVAFGENSGLSQLPYREEPGSIISVSSMHVGSMFDVPSEAFARRLQELGCHPMLWSK